MQVIKSGHFYVSSVIGGDVSWVSAKDEDRFMEFKDEEAEHWKQLIEVLTGEECQITQRMPRNYL